MRKVYGWWGFDHDRQSLIRVSDGASVAFAGFADELPHSALDRWMRLAITLPRVPPFHLLVERRDREGRFKRPLRWRASLSRSFQLLGRAPASFGEASAIERLVLDALTCWPHDTDAGVRPGMVGVEGGWIEGAWSNSLYRMRSAVEIQNIPQKAYSKVAEGCDPAGWTFAPPDERRPFSRALDSLTGASGSQALDALAERAEQHPCLVNGNRLIFPLAREGSLVRWVYIDEEVITDRLTMANQTIKGWPTNWQFHDNGSVRVGTRWRRSGRLVDFHRELGGRKEARIERGDQCREIDPLPLSWAANIHDALCAAMPKWQPARFAIETFGYAGEDAENVELNGFDTLSDNSYSVAGGVRLTHGFIQARSLVDESFRAMFEEPRPATAMVEKADGALAFDHAAAVMRDKDATRSLSFLRTMSGSSDSAESQSFTLRFADTAGHWDLTVERPARVDYFRGREWLVDHNAALAGFRAQAGTALPDEAWWRGADAFIVDALLSWPDCEATGPRAEWLRVTGGFHEGAWEPRLGRILRGGADGTRRSPGADGQWLPWLPSRWRRVLGSFDTKGEPPPLGDAPAAKFDAALAADSFASALWVREDGGAAFGLVGSIYRSGHGGGTTQYWDYWDERLRVRLAWSDRSHLILTPKEWLPAAQSQPNETEVGTPAILPRTGPFRIDTLNEALWAQLRDMMESHLLPGAVVRYDGRYLAGIPASTEVMLYIDDGRLQDYQIRPRP